MPVRIVDAFALGVLIFGEPKAKQIASALEGSPMAAPALIRGKYTSLELQHRISEWRIGGE